MDENDARNIFQKLMQVINDNEFKFIKIIQEYFGFDRLFASIKEQTPGYLINYREIDENILACGTPQRHLDQMRAEFAERIQNGHSLVQHEIACLREKREIIELENRKFEESTKKEYERLYSKVYEELRMSYIQKERKSKFVLKKKKIFL